METTSRQPTPTEQLTRVGTGTVMGDLMRQYWIPALASKELVADGEPRRLVLLGEKLMAFRDSSGRAGVMDHRCPHRLASLFFGGFVLDLHLFNSPGKVISWLLPVTYGIRILQQVMLRGHQPNASDFTALGAQIAIYGSIAVVLFRRRLRVS